jgi:alpha-galactosidase
MRLELDRVVCSPADDGLVVALDLADVGGGSRLTWSVANPGDHPVPVRSVAAVLRVDGAVEPVRMFRNGYQSWSPTGVATFGVDRDPSTTPGSIEFLQAVHHADQRRALDGELRSEWVTVLADAGRSGPVLAGFVGGDGHDGTFRLRRAADGGIELWAEAFLGDAVLGAGSSRPLHPVVLVPGGDRPVEVLLDGWARETAAALGARAGAPYQVGWCSWYHYFHDVTEVDLRQNLALADQWPFAVFQLDDGYQASIGDWLATNDRFPSPLADVAAAIAAAGCRPGIWLAPFLVAPDSQVATEHPDWLSRLPDRSGPLPSWFNPPWGGGQDGIMYGLDTTNPEVLAHLESVAATLVEWGFTYLKLDFTFSPSFDGTWHDPSRTPAERVRAGYEAVRRGAGDDAFLLGCGAPLANVVGVVDGNRIGQDVAPQWALDPSAEIIPGYLAIQPATQHAYVNTVTRSFMHRRLWLNDPDCVMLRASATDLSPEAARTWAHAVAVSGGMALVSDDLALLGPDARALLDEVVAIGRRSDAEAIAGLPAHSPDLLHAAQPTTYRCRTHRLAVDPRTGASTFVAVAGPGQNP